MAVTDAGSNRAQASDPEQAREELIDRETAELNELLDRIDGLTYEARRRLRRLEHHRRGVAPEWTSLHG
ncbi:MAG TPA: hypothetical protein VGH76_17630 [Actinomycetospora sp.]|uniref:hypothetical protein n=1 Tax=Actinomycetospora sp. TaxID=1872135 RepID=UPI002F40330D